MKNIIFKIGTVVIIIICFFMFRDDGMTTKKLITYNGNNLRVSIDGEVINTLPTDGSYYLADYDCVNHNTKLSWDKDNHKLNVTNGTKKADVSCYLEFSSQPLLSQMEVGSYVKYTGNNGCDGIHCEGYNANYINESNMGNCGGGMFNTKGWRIAYVDDGSAYLISAGAPECMCTNENNNPSSVGCNLAGILVILFQYLDEASLKYCNNNYSKGGICDDTTAWGLDSTDFKKMTGYNFNDVHNIKAISGYGNDLFSIKSNYWINIGYASNSGYIWRGSYEQYWLHNVASATLSGLRPILYLDSSVVVTGGSGTFDDPYIIDNNYFDVEEDTGYINDDDTLNSIQLSLNTTNENVSKMCISVDTSECTNYVDFSNSYTLDLSSKSNGEIVIYVYYKDSNDNIVSIMDKAVIIDKEAPTNSSVIINETDGLIRTLTLSSTEADYMCFSNTSNNSTDCTDWVEYTTTYNWWLEKGNGNKTIYAFFKDKANNVADVVSVSTTCTNDCDYKYFIDVLNDDNIYLVRNDGATAKFKINDTSVTWYTESSQNMNVCSICNRSDNTPGVVHYMCIGNDNNTYFKRLHDYSEWIRINSSSYIDTSTYRYAIYVSDNYYNRMVITRNDGKTNYIPLNTSTTWAYGPNESIAMASCSGNQNRIICIGEDGKYYYRESWNTTTDYLGGDIIKLTERTNDNTWIDMYNNTFTNVIESDGTNLYNARFSYNATSTDWYTSTIPGGGIKTCTSGGNNTNNYCIGNDNYLYYKAYNASNWTKTSLIIE